MDEKIRELCRQASLEQNSQKLVLLAQRITELHDEWRMKDEKFAAAEGSSKNGHEQRR